MKHKLLSALWLTAAAAMQILLPFAVSAAYIERGYFAIGGEWIILLLAILFTYFGISELITGSNERRCINAKE